MDYLKVFDLHDTTRSRKLSKVHITCVLRSCGQFLLPKDATALLAPYGDPLTREQFAELTKSLKEPPKEKDLTLAFQAFDYKELGTLNRIDIAQILTQMQEKITADDLQAVLADMPFQQDKVPITSISKHLMAPLASIKVPLEDIPRRMREILSTGSS